MKGLIAGRMLLIGVVLTGACSTSPEAPQGKLRPQAASHYAASNGAGDTLHVGIGGRTLVQTASTQRYSAGITNGTATSYHYSWFTTDCASNCDSAAMELFAEGDGLSTVYIPFASTNDWKIITVHVNELNGTGRSGAARTEVEGPNVASSGVGFVNNPCDYYNDINWFPLTAQSGVHFRRNYCNNAVSSQP
jgi:hypothetical protein